jgi:hypothetical protein
MAIVHCTKDIEYLTLHNNPKVEDLFLDSATHFIFTFISVSQSQVMKEGIYSHQPSWSGSRSPIVILQNARYPTRQFPVQLKWPKREPPSVFQRRLSRLVATPAVKCASHMYCACCRALAIEDKTTKEERIVSKDVCNQGTYFPFLSDNPVVSQTPFAAVLVATAFLSFSKP